MNIRRILIANRGEIAVRIQQTLNRMNIESVIVYHEDEKDSKHVSMGNFAVNLGNGSLLETYLNIPKIISIAKEYRCDAIHPGYGFLSENYQFARACEDNKILFIGPKSEVIRMMGSKSEAKSIAQKAGVPFLKSYIYNDGFEPEKLNLNYPLLIKAVAGGGGKGLKIVKNKSDFQKSLENAKREAENYFNNNELIIESFIEDARHIEVQILGDNHGNIVHLFERECTLQRHHQKIIEEAPATSINSRMKQKMYEASIRLASELNYTNAGTVEYLVSGEQFYFLEMNTRIQVEHPVTEIISGVDIVEQQIHVASGKPLSDTLKNIRLSGHAIEARIYAENPYKDFLSSMGKINYVQFPEKERIDTFILENTTVTPHFDSMLGKLIVKGTNRADAIENLKLSLNQTHIHGVHTNLFYLNQIAEDQAFNDNKISTVYLEKNIDKHVSDYQQIIKEDNNKKAVIAAFFINNFRLKSVTPKNLWEKLDSNIQINKFKIYVDSEEFVVEYSDNQSLAINGIKSTLKVVAGNAHFISIILDGRGHDIVFSKNYDKPSDNYELEGNVFEVASPIVLRMSEYFLKKRKNKHDNVFNQIVSPLFGKVIDINVREQDIVKKGDLLLTIESMKTENHILSPGEGVIQEILVQKGLQVKENVELIRMNPGVQ